METLLGFEWSSAFALCHPLPAIHANFHPEMKKKTPRIYTVDFSSLEETCKHCVYYYVKSVYNYRHPNLIPAVQFKSSFKKIYFHHSFPFSLEIHFFM